MSKKTTLTDLLCISGNKIKKGGTKHMLIATEIYEQLSSAKVLKDQDVPATNWTVWPATVGWKVIWLRPELSV